jgi:3-isopropylmalate dehydratase small subunit
MTFFQRYKHMHTDPGELAVHIFEHLPSKPVGGVREGDVFVGDDVFGIGSSREQAVNALLAVRVGAILPPAFGQIFYRNCWNLGLLALRLNTHGLDEGDSIDVDLRAGTLRRNRDGRPRFSYLAFTPCAVWQALSRATVGKITLSMVATLLRRAIPLWVNMGS